MEVGVVVRRRRRRMMMNGIEEDVRSEVDYEALLIDGACVEYGSDHRTGYVCIGSWNSEGMLKWKPS